jgi:hypothetical protein
MKKPMKYSLFLLAMLVVSGCQSVDWTGSSPVRKRASGAIPAVGRLHDARRADIDQINERYRQAFTRLMEDLETYERLGRWHSSYQSVQTATDAVQMDWHKQTLKTELYALFSRQVEGEIANLDAMYQSLAEGRKTYVDNYQEASLKLKKLEQVQAGLRQLSRNQGLSRDAQDFFTALVEAAEKAVEEQQKTKP